MKGLGTPCRALTGQGSADLWCAGAGAAESAAPLREQPQLGRPSPSHPPSPSPSRRPIPKPWPVVARRGSGQPRVQTWSVGAPPHSRLDFRSARGCGCGCGCGRGGGRDFGSDHGCRYGCCCCCCFSCDCDCAGDHEAPREAVPGCGCGCSCGCSCGCGHGRGRGHGCCCGCNFGCGCIAPVDGSGCENVNGRGLGFASPCAG